MSKLRTLVSKTRAVVEASPSTYHLGGGPGALAPQNVASALSHLVKLSKELEANIELVVHGLEGYEGPGVQDTVKDALRSAKETRSSLTWSANVLKAQIAKAGK